jgi:hypothetical protein
VGERGLRAQRLTWCRSVVIGVRGLILLTLEAVFQIAGENIPCARKLNDF